MILTEELLKEKKQLEKAIQIALEQFIEKAGHVKIDVDVNQQFMRQFGSGGDKYVGMDVKVNITL